HEESEAQNFIYNGTLNATLILDDVHKGDVIEYSYTLKGFNPIFNNKFFERFEAAFDVPVYQLYYKLIVPRGRSLITKKINNCIDPVMSSTPEGTVYEWKNTDVNALRTQDDLPSWFNPYPMTYVSEFE